MYFQVCKWNPRLTSEKKLTVQLFDVQHEWCPNG